MSATLWRKLRIIPTVVALAVVGLSGSISRTTAQGSIPSCKPPSTGEYLLLVISPTTDNQNQLRRALPSDLKTSVCRYLNETVTRIAGFDKVDDANRWAKYVNQIAGLSAIITTKQGAGTPVAQQPKPQPKPQQKPQLETANFKPQPLGPGFAVLVEYFNRPELVSQVGQVVKGDVGFVSYGQRPYLLALYTTTQKEAYDTLQRLTDRGFFAVVADSRKVMLLRRAVVQQ
ncbi:MAG: hypothetical protein KME64_40955 [Scytonematopsis contorta HA4267-MV1]|jgi:hypothetical protein|nr:hypothetical protein [Scytonematopsis contorta HA4267-MV1]